MNMKTNNMRIKLLTSSLRASLALAARAALAASFAAYSSGFCDAVVKKYEHEDKQHAH